jgi:membrane protease YdiL (CAAX protease family)
VRTPSDTADPEPACRLRAQRGLALYFVCVVAGSGACEFWMLQRGTPIEQQPLLALVNMWIPALASVIARVALREGFGDVSFALRGPGAGRSLALGWLAPLGVGLVAYGTAWALRLEAFAAPRLESVGMEQATPALKLATSLAINLSLGTLLASLSALGEEIGWRGFMLTRLIDAGFKRPLLWSGLIWSGWHLPLILCGQYAAGPQPVLSGVAFVLSTTAGGYVAAASGSSQAACGPPSSTTPRGTR